jgi:hypothetical protein
VPRLRPKQEVRRAPTDMVYALTAVSKGGRWVEKGTPLTRTDPMVIERPDLFEVRYRLDEEVTNNGK